MISFTKPLITRILDKNFGKITKDDDYREGSKLWNYFKEN